MEKQNKTGIEAIIEQLADRLKKLERSINRIEGQVADLYGRVR
jgi:hypothetical protein